MTQPGQPPDFSKPQPSPQGPPAPPYQPYPQGQALPYGAGPPGTGLLGKIRPTGVSILLYIVTLGIYGWVWWFKVHAEMKQHRGVGLGGGLALVIAIVISPVLAFITSNEVQQLYESRGLRPPVRTTTGLWFFPGVVLLYIGPIVWFVKTNGALNDYWRSLGAHG